MPTYEYACPDCKHAFEVFHSITAKPIRKCPECGERKVERLISGGAGLLFKGSGFYITDYRSDNYKSAAKKDSDASSGSSTESKKTDTKKTDTKKSDTKKSDTKKDAA
jgi:putative FmdB family regulatory protein